MHIPGQWRRTCGTEATEATEERAGACATNWRLSSLATPNLLRCENWLMILPPSTASLFGSLGLVLLALLVIALTARKLATGHGSDVRIVWYFFALALTATLLIAWWASGVGAIDASGGFRGKAGAVLLGLLRMTLDVGGGLKFYGAAVALIVVPQMISWALSGLAGCAAAPILVGPALRFFMWSVVKTLVIAAGVILGATVYGWWQSWSGLNGSKVLELTGSAFVLVASSFVTIYVFRDAESPLPPGRSSPRAAKLGKVLRRLNDWMNRRIIQPSPPL